MCIAYSVFLFFFFKQKTAYEMRISDWSSDVCSSDLVGAGRRVGGGGQRDGLAAADLHAELAEQQIFRTEVMPPLRDAMGLVDGQQLDVRAREQRRRLRPRQTLRRDVEELQPPLAQRQLGAPELLGLRSEKRHVGKACDRSCKSPWSPLPEKKQQK